MKVKHIEWLSKVAAEAMVTMTDGSDEVTAFCHPCDLSANEEVTGPLRAFDVEGLCLATESAMIPSIIKLPKGLGYEIVGTVRDSRLKLVTVGTIPIECDLPMPKDITDGALVVFTCARLDV